MGNAIEAKRTASHLLWSATLVFCLRSGASRESMRNYRKNNRKRLGFEALEQRKLLAGDFASGIVAAIDVGIVEEVEVQAAEVSSLEIEEVDQALQELLADESSNGTEIELGQDLANQTGSADETSLIDTAPVAAGTENLDPRNLDLTDSMDGFFGSISPESPTCLLYTSPSPRDRG